MFKYHPYTVAPKILEELSFLQTLAGNVWWSWNFPASNLFRSMNPRLFKECGLNPQRLLAELPQERFEELLAQNAFLEYAKVHDNYYGTLKAPIEEVLAEGSSMILDIDVQGAAKVRDYVRALPNNDPLKIGYVDIFVSPPSLEELRERLVRRGTDSAATIERRMANAEGEIARAGEYMYRVTNDELDVCFKRLCDLIDALSGRM